MNLHDGFDRTVSDWLDEQAGHGMPGYLDEILVKTTRSRQRPWWASLERLLPVQTTLRLSPVPRLAWLLVVLGLIVVLGVAAVAIGSRYHQPAPPFGLARNGPILYGATDDDIYALDPVTGASTALITGSAGDHRPLLSPDGTKLLFLRDSTSREQGFGPLMPMIMVANGDGSDIRAVTEPLKLAGVQNIAWSHDGTMVAVISDVDSKAAIQVFRVDGSSPPVVLDTPGLTEINYLAFRAGDRELTFRGATPETASMFAVGPNGSGYRTIAHVTDGDGASLSPDGTKIAYQTWDGTRGVIHVVDVDNGLDTIPAFDPPSTASLVDDTPAWSPDGTRFLFIRYDVGADNHLVVASATGGPRVQIGPAMPNAAKTVSAQFSPDGSRVLAYYSADGSTWLLDPAGSGGDVRMESTITDVSSWQRLAP